MGATFVPVVTAIGTLLGGAAAVITAKKTGVVAPAAAATPEAVVAEKREKKAILAEAPGEAERLAKEAEKKRRKARAKTLVTGPRGVLTEAPVTRKTLLGE